MARILMTVPPLVGHFNPALEVADELRRAGHEIAWCLHHDQLGKYLPQNAVVFPLHADGSADFAARLASLSGFKSVQFFVNEFLIPLSISCLEALEDAVERFQPDVMIVDHQMVAGALVARKTGIPWITLVTTTASILKLLPAHDVWLVEQYQDLQQRYLAPEDMVERPDFSPHAVVVFSLELLVGNHEERFEGNYVFVGPAKGGGRQPVAFPWGWLQDGKKKLLVTLGTVSRDRDTRFFEVMMEAVASLDLQAVFVAPDSIEALAPANVLVRQFVPQLALLKHMDAVVCHAGHNTVCESLSAGVPLLVAPIRDDQPIVARQVVKAGAGIQIRYGKITVNHARSEIDRLLRNNQTTERARAISAEFASASGPAAVVGIVEQFVA